MFNSGQPSPVLNGNVPARLGHRDIDAVLVHIRAGKQNAGLLLGTSALLGEGLVRAFMARRGSVRAIHDNPEDGRLQIDAFCAGRTRKRRGE